MIKYFKRKLLQWVSEEQNEVRNEYAKNAIISVGKEIPQYDHEGSFIQFEIRPAIGGRILKVTRTNVDHHTGRAERDFDTYIITDSDNLGERVSKIINLQAYK